MNLFVLTASAHILIFQLMKNGNSNHFQICFSSSLHSEGDPICDRYGLHIYENRIIATIADGCNWGTMPRDAAINASNAFALHLKHHLDEITDSSAIGPLLIKAMSVAHEAVSNFRCVFIILF